jgi:hypothetical protein
MVMVTGAAPQLNVMIPPAATALTTAAEVQLPGVPVPTTWSGLLVFTAFAAAGTAACPAGFPGRGSARAFGADGEGDGDEVGVGASDGNDDGLLAAGPEAGGVTNVGLSGADPQPTRARPLTRAVMPTR